jgi:Fe(3+) dicitrate transport protein
MMPARRFLALGLVSMAALPTPLAAQARDSVVLAEIRVVGSVDHMRLIPGSASQLDEATLRLWRPSTINETLRRVPGVVARDEEGLGLRPNIGIRGLNPTRSSKVLLLEDGIPLTFAPYGDNATYYHPPVDRFDRIEVLKGSGQILFGPQTVGGVINYVTPRVPVAPAGTVTIGAGSRDFLNIAARAGASYGRAGALLGLMRRHGDGARANTGTQLEDAFLKTHVALGATQGLTARANLYRERSNVTYSGLTEAEWAAEPRANPFVNDSMLLDRWGLSLSHELRAGALTLTTTAYGSGVDRAWWRQSSNSEQRPNDSSDPTCGGMDNLSTTCGNQGRVRAYTMFGLEPRLRSVLALGGAPLVLDAGVRAHFERQRRRQINSDTPTGRTPGPSSNVGSGILEDNARDNAALSAFAQGRLQLGAWSVTPGVRLEHVRYERTNRLADPAVSGRTALTQLVPGLGATYSPSGAVGLFGGVHRGFAPPRTEDVIDNSSGAVVNLDAELSWNWEAGVRVGAGAWSFESTLFLMDFENQIVPASVAGGAGAALTNAGATRHAGLELAWRRELGHRAAPHHGFVQGSVTWLPLAEFAGRRFVFVGTGGGDVVGKIYAAQNGTATRALVDVAGHRLPYAPRATATLAAGYGYRATFDVRVEAVRVGEQFADALNSPATIPDGQQGVLPASTLWNAAATWTFLRHSAAFVSVQNLFDALYVADRTRGLLPGTPRSVQIGVSQGF